MTDFEPKILISRGAGRGEWRKEGGAMIRPMEKYVIGRFAYESWHDLPKETEIVLLPREDFDIMLDDLKGHPVTPRRNACLLRVSLAATRGRLIPFELISFMALIFCSGIIIGMAVSRLFTL